MAPTIRRILGISSLRNSFFLKDSRVSTGSISFQTSFGIRLLPERLRVASRNFGGLRAFAGSCPFPSIQLQMATPTSLRCEGSPLQAPKHHHSSTGVWWWKPRLNLWKIWLEKSSGMNKVTAPTWQQETPQTANLRGCVRKGTFHMVPVKERESGQRPKGGYLCEVAVNETSLLSVHAPTFCTQCPELHLQRTSLKSVGTCHSLSSKLNEAKSN